MSKLGVCINLRGLNVSQISNLDFNSSAEIDGKTLVAGPAGVYQFGDSCDDDGEDIRALARTGRCNFGDVHNKRVRKCFFTLIANGSLTLHIYGDETREREFTVEPDATDMTSTKAVVNGSRDVWGKSLEFQIENVEGSQFSIDKLAILPILRR